MSAVPGSEPGDEVAVGFDAREMHLDPRTQWPADRRAAYLLRPDVAKPLSIDPLVWPALLATHGRTTGLWPDRASLERQLRAADAPLAGKLVACTLYTDLGEREREAWSPRLDGSEPAPDPGWSQLGYDVADLALISGLSNCGYDADEIEALRARWGPRLNEHHLFGRVDSAVEFKRLSDDRVPEHTPFFVFGLYLVADIDT